MKRTSGSERTKGYCFSWRPRGERQILWLGVIRTFIAENERYGPFLGRQLFYMLVGKGLASKEPRNKQDKSFDAISVNELLNDARRAGLIRWDDIADDDAQVDLDPDVRTATEVLHGADTILMQYARIDLWKAQPERVAIFVEAKGQVTQVETMVANYRTPVYASGGFGKSNRSHAFAKEVSRFDQPWRVLTIGDLDPSGWTIVRSREADIGAFVAYYAGKVEFEHVALTIEQAQNYPDGVDELTAEDRRHSHAKQYPYTIKVQSAAIPPAELEAVLQRRIAALIDPHAWADSLAEERQERRIVSRQAKQWIGTLA